MAHRFIVGETPAAALGVLRELWNHGVASSVDLLGEATVTQPEADRYAARCDEALVELARAQAAWPGSRGARAGQRRSDPTNQRVGQDLGADPAAPARRARARAARRGRAPAACCSATPASSAPTSTSTWSRSTRARRCSTSCSRCCPRTSSATARRRGWSSRPTCATRPSSSIAVLGVGAQRRGGRRR